jgi:hypothetical protein
VVVVENLRDRVEFAPPSCKYDTSSNRRKYRYRKQAAHDFNNRYIHMSTTVKEVEES